MYNQATTSEARTLRGLNSQSRWYVRAKRRSIAMLSEKSTAETNKKRDHRQHTTTEAKREEASSRVRARSSRRTKPVHQITQNLVCAEGAEKGPAFLARARGCSLVVDSSLRKLRKNTAIRKKETGVTTWRTKQRSRLACLALLDSRERLHVHLLPRLHTSSRKPANR